jgi:hypothetical protein
MWWLACVLECWGAGCYWVSLCVISRSGKRARLDSAMLTSLGFGVTGGSWRLRRTEHKKRDGRGFCGETLGERTTDRSENGQGVVRLQRINRKVTQI